MHIFSCIHVFWLKCFLSFACIRMCSMLIFICASYVSMYVCMLSGMSHSRLFMYVCIYILEISSAHSFASTWNRLSCLPTIAQVNFFIFFSGQMDVLCCRSACKYLLIFMFVRTTSMHRIKDAHNKSLDKLAYIPFCKYLCDTSNQAFVGQRDSFHAQIFHQKHLPHAQEISLVICWLLSLAETGSVRRMKQR